MSREIKFRAWHHGAGDPRVEGRMVFSEPFASLFWSNVEDEAIAVEVMQYTGMYDKACGQIFEGDIMGGGDAIPQEVTFDDGAFGFSSDRQGHSPLTKDRAARLFILGNIHQNPELLDSD